MAAKPNDFDLQLERLQEKEKIARVNNDHPASVIILKDIVTPHSHSDHPMLPGAAVGHSQRSSHLPHEPKRTVQEGTDRNDTTCHDLACQYQIATAHSSDLNYPRRLRQKNLFGSLVRTLCDVDREGEVELKRHLVGSSDSSVGAGLNLWFYG